MDFLSHFTDISVLRRIFEVDFKVIITWKCIQYYWKVNVNANNFLKNESKKKSWGLKYYKFGLGRRRNASGLIEVWPFQLKTQMVSMDDVLPDLYAFLHSDITYIILEHRGREDPLWPFMTPYDHLWPPSDPIHFWNLIKTTLYDPYGPLHFQNHILTTPL